QAGQEKESDHEYIMLPFMPSYLPLSSSIQSSDDKDADEAPGKGGEGVSKGSGVDNQERFDGSPQDQDVNTTEPSINTANTNINTSSLNINIVGSNDPSMPSLEETGIFDNVYDDREVAAEADTNNLEPLTVIDVKSAFLYGTIKEEVYVCQHPSFEDPHFPNKVYKVEKALYGLHQALRAWYETLSTYLLENRFRRDDAQEIPDKFYKGTHFLLRVTTSTLMEPNNALIKDPEAEDVDVHLYRLMIGSLMYLIAFRPDIMFAICACAGFQVTPKTSHIHVVKRIFRYLKGQPKLGLWYLKDSPFDLEAFSDSDYVGVSLDRKSTTGEMGFVMNLEFKLVVGQRLVLNRCLDWIALAAQNEIQVKTVNEDVRLQALVDGKKVILNEASIRRDLRLDDAEGTACLPMLLSLKNWQEWDTPILTQPSSSQPQRKHKLRRKQRKETEVSQDDIPTEEHMPTPSHDPLPSGKDRLQLNELMEICTKLSDRVLSLEKINTNQVVEIEMLKKRIKKLKGKKKKKRTHRLKILYKVGFNARIISSDKEGLDQERMNDQDMCGFNDLDGDEVVVDVSAGEKEEQSDKVAKRKLLLLIQLLLLNLIEIKAAEPKALTNVAITVNSLLNNHHSLKKGKAKMVEPERPLKRKKQIMMDEQIARDLEAQMQADLEEEKMITKEKEEGANIAMIAEWDNIQDMMDADYELAAKL
nr:hypothetical protein [Tanacetum cinerariifolium]